MTSFTHDGVTLILGDCMEHMARMADGAYSLAIVDPPYGIGEANEKRMLSRHYSQKKYAGKDWDSQPPPLEYFCELRRVSKNQIVWGANHFISKIALDSSCWIFWDKDRYGDFADGELAYTSFKTAVRCFKYTWDGFRKQHQEERFHPTQKPTALYRWLLQNYARPGDTILDTHLGSGSSAIAAWEMGFTFTGIEIDEDYFNAAVERFRKRIAQPYLPGLAQPAKPKQDILL